MVCLQSVDDFAVLGGKSGGGGIYLVDAQEGVYLAVGALGHGGQQTVHAINRHAGGGVNVHILQTAVQTETVCQRIAEHGGIIKEFVADGGLPGYFLRNRIRCGLRGGAGTGTGADQYRGWFQSSLLTSVGALDNNAPFKQVLTHGWVVDGQGRAMHKSLGNGVDPADLIKDFGADIVRLWAASSDYHADVRCSKEIFKQIAQNYLKFRNTARYCLGNLADFDPNKDMVAAENMEELDRWALTKLNDLTAFVRKAYNSYEFHTITHAINDFCVVELSSFYLDILKDRLYCEEAGGLRRRSAQTALYLIVDAMAKLFAPILAFTCDEIWQAMPHLCGDDTRNILLNQMPERFDAYLLSDEAMEKWSTVMKLRQDVNGVLEKARAEKRIGKALEAHVALSTDNDAIKAACEGLNLAEICIVSSCNWEAAPEGAEIGAGINLPELTVAVTEAKGTKCPRCWMHSEKADAEGLCPRCAKVVSTLDIEL